jgi:pilus assembly protein Flp/PilA
MDADPGEIMYVQALLIWLGAAIGTGKSTHPQNHEFLPESGQGLVEYALILVFVGVVVMALLLVLGPTISNMFTNIIENVQGTQQ